MVNNPRLVMSQGPQPGQTFMLDQDLLIVGRDPGSDIVISDPQVSRQHARIRRQGSLTVIEDIGSTNGTFVNGVRLTGPHTLINDEVIALGDAVTLTYYGVDVAVTEPIAGRPTTISPAPPSHRPQPTPPPGYATPSPAGKEPVRGKKSKTWLWVGCGCLILLAAAGCIGIFVLDYLKLLPAFFYEPLRWLGLI